MAHDPGPLHDVPRRRRPPRIRGRPKPRA